MRRACQVTLRFVTARKRRAISALLKSYRIAVNFFIQSLWDQPGKLDAVTLTRLQYTRLSARYKSQALKQALEIVTSTRKAAKVTKKCVSVPVFKGSAILDAKFVIVEEGCGSFDLVVRLSSLKNRLRDKSMSPIAAALTIREATYTPTVCFKRFARAKKSCSLFTFF